MKNLFTKPLKLIPNLKVEPAHSKAGYSWGKIASQSHILATINPEFIDLIPAIQDDDLVAERWICSDDKDDGSKIITGSGKAKLFANLLEKHGKDILGPEHLQKFGPQLNSQMKLVESNQEEMKLVFQAREENFEISSNFKSLSSNQIVDLFSSKSLTVQQIQISTQIDFSLAQRGVPIYLQTGEIEIINSDGQVIDHLTSGDERFLPLVLGEITFRAIQPTVMLTW